MAYEVNIWEGETPENGKYRLFHSQILICLITSLIYRRCLGYCLTRFVNSGLRMPSNHVFVVFERWNEISSQGEGLEGPHNGLKTVLLWIHLSNVIKSTCPHTPFVTRSTSQESLKILSTSLAHLQLKKYFGCQIASNLRLTWYSGCLTSNLSTGRLFRMLTLNKLPESLVTLIWQLRSQWPPDSKKHPRTTFTSNETKIDNIYSLHTISVNPPKTKS